MSTVEDQPYDSTNPEHVRRMFACRVCGAQCPGSPGYDKAICENCCDEHDYEYSRDQRTHCCRHCEKPVDPDWYEE